MNQSARFMLYLSRMYASSNFQYPIQIRRETSSKMIEINSRRVTIPQTRTRYRKASHHIDAIWSAGSYDV